MKNQIDIDRLVADVQAVLEVDFPTYRLGSSNGNFFVWDEESEKIEPLPGLATTQDLIKFVGRNKTTVKAGLAKEVRLKRNKLLVDTDWTQLLDVSEARRAAYAAYRQQLRDIPSQEGFPHAVVFPEPPVI